MATLNITNGVLDLKIIKGDGLHLYLDFNIPLTGFSFSSSIENVVTGVKTNLTVTAVDLALGQIVIEATPEALALVPLGKHKWYFKWVPPSAPPRTAIGGVFEVATV